MYILYGIQGTGNGHKSRAETLIPAPTKHTKVDVLVSGLPLTGAFKTTIDVDYRCEGYGFIFGKNGGIDFS